MKKITLAFGMAAIGLVACSSQDVHAATATATMDVSATVEASCTIQTAPLSFGTYRPTDSAGLSSQAAFTLKCSDGAAPKVSIQAANNNFDSATGTRKLSNTAQTATLDYVLFQPTDNTPNSACGTFGPSSAIWGPTTDFGLTGLSFTGSNYNICGFLSGLQNKPAGDYKDTVTVSVSF
jgi:spore coat protein U-like protein